MKAITLDQAELIEAVLAELDVGLLTASILEKDVHVTDALCALLGMEYPATHLVFCGGTSLSKAYGLIERMSEDVDLKVVLDEPSIGGASAVKKHLSQLKVEVARLLESMGFVEDSQQRIARNQNRYFATRWQYQSRYQHDASLRPYLSLELTVRRPQFATTRQPLDYLVERLASRSRPLGQIECVAVEETLAEKVISFLRRYAQHHAGAMQQDWDRTLVRHIYDVFCICRAGPDITERAVAGFQALVAFDVQEFGQQFPPFATEPKAVLSAALGQAEKDPAIREDYDARLLPLVFGSVRPGFDEAYGVFRQQAEFLIDVL
ncbi:TPA: nucleotidyl transferase AbiEii/AbiGii toxin family protein [Pseudomonas aeruginosa]|nr:nucleotidyl transferase AbiEii/AbiGii toxin family protein [Pseudomonas aeruginosa]HBP6820340.1 nucleotidyl transferase AbiEii/AbiGii toxin family protein [Pseudomonas aeruginosa]